MNITPEAAAELVRTLSVRHGCAGVQFSIGNANLPQAILTNAKGENVLISFYGGQVLRWIDTKARSVLYLSENAVFQEGKSIRGGIPIVFPWFGENKSVGMQHGFAQNVLWEFNDCSSAMEEVPWLKLRLKDTSSTRALWPHSFTLDVTYKLADSFEILIYIKNTGDSQFTAQCVLHNYFVTGSINNVQIRGLEKCRFTDKALGGLDGGQSTSKPLKFSGLTERIYTDVKDTLLILGIGGYGLSLESTMPDRVAWNPGKIAGDKITDLPPLAYDKFVCVESGVISDGITIGSKSSWTSSQKISLAPPYFR